MLTENIYIFHIVAFDNLQSIIKNNGLFSSSKMRNNKIHYTNIGNSRIKDRRSEHYVNSLSCYLSNCVPFYFTTRSPMLYAIYKRNQELDYSSGQENIIYLCSQIKYVQEAQLAYTFTDGHALENFSNYYDNINELSKLDWKAINTTGWSKSYGVDDDFKRRKQAEFLVKDFFPFSLIKCFVVHNETIYNKVKKQCPNLPVEIKPTWYY